MNKALPALLVLALGGMTWFILSRSSDDGTPASPATAPPSDSNRTTPAPLPRAALEPEAPVSAPVDLQYIEQKGLLGQADRWLSERMAKAPGFKPVEGSPRTWKNERATVQWLTDKSGRVTGADAVFTESSLSADLTALSPLFVGSQHGLPIHLEVHTPEEAQAATVGSFEMDETLYHYKADFRATGEPPYGPARFELRFEPF
jgi:hypothetical protein